MASKRGSAARRHSNSLRALRDVLRTSLWPLPAFMGLVAAVLAPVSPWVDGRLGSGPDENYPFFIYVSGPSQAHDLLATILTSMFTMTSLVFSITMVVLTLAAGAVRGTRLERGRGPA